MCLALSSLLPLYTSRVCEETSSRVCEETSSRVCEETSSRVCEETSSLLPWHELSKNIYDLCSATAASVSALPGIAFKKSKFNVFKSSVNFYCFASLIEARCDRNRRRQCAVHCCAICFEIRNATSTLKHKPPHILKHKLQMVYLAVGMYENLFFCLTFLILCACGGLCFNVCGGLCFNVCGGACFNVCGGLCYNVRGSLCFNVCGGLCFNVWRLVREVRVCARVHTPRHAKIHLPNSDMQSRHRSLTLRMSGAHGTDFPAGGAEDHRHDLPSHPLHREGRPQFVHAGRQHARAGKRKANSQV